MQLDRRMAVLAGFARLAKPSTPPTAMGFVWFEHALAGDAASISAAASGMRARCCKCWLFAVTGEVRSLCSGCWSSKFDALRVKNRVFSSLMLEGRQSGLQSSVRFG